MSLFEFDMLSLVVLFLPIILSIYLTSSSVIKNKDLNNSQEKKLQDKNEHLKELLFELTEKLHDCEEEVRNIKSTITIDTKQEKKKIMMLVIAPGSNLNFDNELRGIFNSGVDYTIIKNHVTKTDIIHELSRKVYSVLHYMGHADENGAQLSDDIAENGWWRRIISRYNFDLLFFNGCETLEITNNLIGDNVGCAIAISEEIENNPASLFSEEFYFWLSQSKSIKESYEMARLTLKTEDAELIRLLGQCDKSLV